MALVNEQYCWSCKELTMHLNGDCKRCTENNSYGTEEKPDTYQLTPEMVKNLAIDFWAKNGENPTHLLLSKEDHIVFSSLFVPVSPSNNPPLAITSYTLENGVTIKLVVCDVLSGSGEFLPKMMRIE